WAPIPPDAAFGLCRVTPPIPPAPLGEARRGVRVLQAPPVAVHLRSPGKRSAPGNEDVARTSIRDWRPFPRMRPSALSGLRAGPGVIQPVVRRESESPDNGTVTNP